MKATVSHGHASRYNIIYDSPPLQRVIGKTNNITKGFDTFDTTVNSSSSTATATTTTTRGTRTDPKSSSNPPPTQGKGRNNGNTTNKTIKGLKVYQGYDIDVFNDITVTPPRKSVNEVTTVSLNEKRVLPNTNNSTTVLSTTIVTKRKSSSSLASSTTKQSSFRTAETNHGRDTQTTTTTSTPVLSPHAFSFVGSTDNDNDDPNNRREEDENTVPLVNADDDDDDAMDEQDHQSFPKDGTDDDDDDDDDAIYTSSSKKQKTVKLSTNRSKPSYRRHSLSNIRKERLDTTEKDDEDNNTVSIGGPETSSDNSSSGSSDEGFTRRRRSSTNVTRRTKSVSSVISGSRRQHTNKLSSSGIVRSVTAENYRPQEEDYRSFRRFERSIAIFRDAEQQYLKRTTFPASVMLEILKVFRIPRSVFNIIIERRSNATAQNSTLTNESIKLLTERENDREGYRRLQLIQQVLRSIHSAPSSSSTATTSLSSSDHPVLTEEQRIAAQAISDARVRFMSLANSAIGPYDIETNGSPEQHARTLIERKLTFGKLQLRNKELTKQSFALKLARSYDKLRNHQPLNDDEEHTVWLAEQQEKRKMKRNTPPELSTVNDIDNDDGLYGKDDSLKNKENYDIDWETSSAIYTGESGMSEADLARIMPIEKINEWKSDATMGPLLKDAVAAADRILTRKIDTYVPCTLGSYIHLMQNGCDTVGKQFIKGRSTTITNKNKKVSSSPPDDESIGSSHESNSDNENHNNDSTADNTAYPGNIRLGHIRHTIRPAEKIYGESALQELQKELEQQSSRNVAHEKKMAKRDANNDGESNHSFSDDSDNDDEEETSETIKKNIKLFERMYEKATQPLLTPFGYWLKHRAHPDHYLPVELRSTRTAYSKWVEYTPATFAALPKEERVALWDKYTRQVSIAEKNELRNSSVYEFIYHVRSLTSQMGTIEKDHSSKNGSASFVPPLSGRTISSRDMQLKHGTLLPKLKAHHAAEYTFQTYLPVPSLAVAEYYNRQLQLRSKQITQQVQDYNIRMQDADTNENETILSPLRIDYQEQSIPNDDGDDELSMDSDVSDDEEPLSNGIDRIKGSIPPSPSTKETIYHYRRRIWNQTRSYFHRESQLMKAIRSIIPGFRTRLRIGSYTINGSVFTNSRRIIVADIISPNIRFLWTPSPRAGDPSRRSIPNTTVSTSSTLASSSASSSSGRLKLLTRLSPNWNPMAPFNSPEALYTLPGTVTIQYMIRIRSISEEEYAYYEGLHPRPPEYYRNAGVKFVKSHPSFPQDTSFFSTLPLPTTVEDEEEPHHPLYGGSKPVVKRRRKYNKKVPEFFGNENPLTNDVDDMDDIGDINQDNNTTTTRGGKKESYLTNTATIPSLMQTTIGASSISTSNSAASMLKLSVLQSPITPYRGGKSAADIANSITSSSRGRYNTYGNKITPPRPLYFTGTSPSSSIVPASDKKPIITTTTTDAVDARSIRGKLNFDNTEIDLTTIADMKAATRRDYGKSKESLTLSKLTTTSIPTDTLTTAITPSRKRVTINDYTFITPGTKKQ